MIVPARAGSKGLANKNIRHLGGKPLLYWSAAAIQKADITESLSILSTDSEEYAQIGKACGLEAPFLRPSQYSNDQSSAIDVILHSLQWFKETYNYHPKYVMLLQPTSPFRTAQHIKQAWELIQQENIDSVIGCQQIFRDESTLFHLQSNYLSALAKGKTIQQRRQEVPPLLTPNGCMYLTRTDIILQHQSFYPSNTIPLICDKISSMDLDTEQDWLIAESILNNNYSAL